MTCPKNLTSSQVCLPGDWQSVKNPSTSPRAGNALILLSIRPGHIKSCPFRQNLFILLFPLPQKTHLKRKFGLLLSSFFFRPALCLMLSLHQHRHFFPWMRSFMQASHWQKPSNLAHLDRGRGGASPGPLFSASLRTGPIGFGSCTSFFVHKLGP